MSSAPVEQQRHDLDRGRRPRAGRKRRLQPLLDDAPTSWSIRACRPRNGRPCEGSTRQSSGSSRKRSSEVRKSASGLASGSAGQTPTLGEIRGRIWSAAIRTLRSASYRQSISGAWPRPTITRHSRPPMRSRSPSRRRRKRAGGRPPGGDRGCRARRASRPAPRPGRRGDRTRARQRRSPRSCPAPAARRSAIRCGWSTARRRSARTASRRDRDGRGGNGSRAADRAARRRARPPSSPCQRSRLGWSASPASITVQPGTSSSSQTLTWSSANGSSKRTPSSPGASSRGSLADLADRRRRRRWAAAAILADADRSDNDAALSAVFALQHEGAEPTPRPRKLARAVRRAKSGCKNAQIYAKLSCMAGGQRTPANPRTECTLLHAERSG